jgi:phospholipid/cholesterol/gamma-HCH transport system substrate-binding protein
MISSRNVRPVLAVALALILVAGIGVLARSTINFGKTHLVAYFDNSNGVFPGDSVFVLGVPIGKIDTIEPQPQRAKITFWVDDKYKVPADVKAVILSPQLITSRAIQLTPAYTSGPQLRSGAVIPEERTAVPVEWDDFRQQLEKLSQSLQPAQPGGVSPLGSIINTAAANLRGQGASIRDAIIEASQAFSTLGDHSQDIFSTIKNLAILVSALQSSSDLMAQLNRNLATVTGLLADDPDEIGRALDYLNTAAGDVTAFVADNREALGTLSDKLTSVSQMLVGSLDDVKQTLHVLPNALQNFVNIYEPAHASITGLLAFNNFSNPITFLCGAIQAASRLGAEQSAKLCAQYLAPIVKNRQLNFPPIGLSPLVGATARPNEVTYSEDWMRPEFQPGTPKPPDEQPSAGPELGAPDDAALPAEAPLSTDPAQGLPGLMVPPGGGS